MTQAVLAVQADNQTKVYGAAVPPLTFSYSGFVNGEDTNVLSGTPVLRTDAGLYGAISNSPYVIEVLVGTLSASNYTFSLIHGQLAVAEPPN